MSSMSWALGRLTTSARCSHGASRQENRPPFGRKDCSRQRRTKARLLPSEQRVRAPQPRWGPRGTGDRASSWLWPPRGKGEWTASAGRLPAGGFQRDPPSGPQADDGDGGTAEVGGTGHQRGTRLGDRESDDQSVFSVHASCVG